MWIDSITEEDATGTVPLPYGPTVVQEPLAKDVIDNYNSDVVAVQVSKAADDLFSKTFCSQNFQNPEKYHKIKRPSPIYSTCI